MKIGENIKPKWEIRVYFKVKHGVKISVFISYNFRSNIRRHKDHLGVWLFRNFLAMAISINFLIHTASSLADQSLLKYKNLWSHQSKSSQLPVIPEKPLVIIIKKLRIILLKWFSLEMILFSKVFALLRMNCNIINVPWWYIFRSHWSSFDLALFLLTTHF